MSNSPPLWRAKVVPDFCERMIGFSVPNANGEVLLLCYDGLKVMNLSNPISVRSLPVPADYDVFDYYPESASLAFRDEVWQLIGLYPGTPVTSRPNGQRLIVNEAELTISIVNKSVPVWTDHYENFSGDWVAASFSPDYWYIVLGCPYDFDFRVWERLPAA